MIKIPGESMPFLTSTSTETMFSPLEEHYRNCALTRPEATVDWAVVTYAADAREQVVALRRAEALSRSK